MCVLRRDRPLGHVMGNHTFKFKKALTGQNASAEWYINKANEYRREIVQDEIDEELSGCWRCSGREKGLCDCCSHMQEAKRLEKLLL